MLLRYLRYLCRKYCSEEICWVDSFLDSFLHLVLDTLGIDVDKYDRLETAYL
jgi:hypothetical protein